MPTSSEPTTSSANSRQAAPTVCARWPARQRGHVGPVADGDDPAAGDGDGLGRGPRVVDGEHASGGNEISGGHGLKSY
ncbi:hypothetical protein AWC15_03790 [Mycobacterium lacus]|nr:hypothetical protein AWC15_03790 [Mycobacterium lacus]